MIFPSGVLSSLEFPVEIPDCLTGRPPLDAQRWYQAQLGEGHIAVVLMKTPDAGGRPVPVATAVRECKYDMDDPTEAIDIVKELKNEIIKRAALAVAVCKALPGVEVLLIEKGF